MSANKRFFSFDSLSDISNKFCLEQIFWHSPMWCSILTIVLRHISSRWFYVEIWASLGFFPLLVVLFLQVCLLAFKIDDQSIFKNLQNPGKWQIKLPVVVLSSNDDISMFSSISSLGELNPAGKVSHNREKRHCQSPKKNVHAKAYCGHRCEEIILRKIVCNLSPFFRFLGGDILENPSQNQNRVTARKNSDIDWTC